MTIQGLSKCNTLFADFPPELQQEIRDSYKAFPIVEDHKTNKLTLENRLVGVYFVSFPCV